ncbi:Hypothetical Protein FCC1311_038692 [Hondaea fermentalgiana]|uniref:Uncharacterized protein n=1 Tax=Hondaea fermentalgiana TaxID=2315210 RepID=A0A2R5G9D8_9STRA|nr:Hypothetical Protein FCC1311_038692 [Hondaea fermentalgiana]|eukprot:GBG27646.1 Hypothetical Protein FCC1311_038692 [Hondaea fermentalgiana]
MEDEASAEAVQQQQQQQRQRDAGEEGAKAETAGIYEDATAGEIGSSSSNNNNNNNNNNSGVNSCSTGMATNDTDTKTKTNGDILHGTSNNSSNGSNKVVDEEGSSFAQEIVDEVVASVVAQDAVKSQGSGSSQDAEEESLSICVDDEDLKAVASEDAETPATIVRTPTDSEVNAEDQGAQEKDNSQSGNALLSTPQPPEPTKTQAKVVASDASHDEESTLEDMGSTEDEEEALFLFDANREAHRLFAMAPQHAAAESSSLGEDASLRMGELIEIVQRLEQDSGDIVSDPVRIVRVLEILTDCRRTNDTCVWPNLEQPVLFKDVRDFVAIFGPAHVAFKRAHGSLFDKFGFVRPEFWGNATRGTESSHLFADLDAFLCATNAHLYKPKPGPCSLCGLSSHASAHSSEAASAVRDHESSSDGSSQGLTNPDELDFLLRKGADRFQKGARDEAENIFRDVWERAERNVAYQIDYGAEAKTSQPTTNLVYKGLLQHDARAAWCKCIACSSLRAQARALGNIGHIYSDRKKVPEAVELYEQSLPILREMGMWKQEPIVLSSLTQCAYLANDAALGGHYGVEYMGTVTQSNDRANLMRRLGDLGAIEAAGRLPKDEVLGILRAGDLALQRSTYPERAAAMYLRSVHLARCLPSDLVEVNALIRAGCSLYMMNRLRAAIMYLERAVLLLRSNNASPENRHVSRQRVELHNLALSFVNQATNKAGFASPATQSAANLFM